MLAGTSLRAGDFVAVDIETTGCRPGSDSIIEIGAVRISAGVVAARFSSLVATTSAIPSAVRHLTGIDESMLVGAPSVAEVMEEFRRFADGAVLIAHNHRFDLGFLDYEAECAWGEPFSRPVLDTLTLSRKLTPDVKRHNLHALAEFYGTESVPTHRAEDDAAATAEIFIQMLQELLERGMETAGDAARFCGLARQGVLARKLTMTTGVPDGPGVYLFRDLSGTVIHVGRAKNLRSRVRSYFYVPSDQEHPHPAIDAASLQFIPCVSPLDAVLLESRLMARYHPRFDRDHERGRVAVYVHSDTSSRYPSLRVVTRRYATGTTIGPLTNAWAAETLVEMLRERYTLRRCARRLGKKSSAIICAKRPEGDCPQPCVGGVAGDEYRERIEAALAVFDGGVGRFRSEIQALREKAAAEQRYELAIAYRDAIRALDRTISALDIFDDARAAGGTVIVEGDDRAVALHLTLHGYLITTLRYTRRDVEKASWPAELKRAITGVYCRHPVSIDPPLTGRQMRDIFLIHAYRVQASPHEIRIGESLDESARRISAAVRRFMRITRKGHAVSSGA